MVKTLRPAYNKPDSTATHRQKAGKPS